MKIFAFIQCLQSLNNKYMRQNNNYIDSSGFFMEASRTISCNEVSISACTGFKPLMEY